MAVAMIEDPALGELRRETGYGQIEDVKLPAGKRNAQVVIKAEQLKDPVQGWVDSTGDRDTYLAAVSAQEQGQRIYYQIDTHRKDSVDVSIPFESLGRGDKVRDVRVIQAVNGKGQPISGSVPEQGPVEQPTLPVSGNGPGNEEAATGPGASSTGEESPGQGAAAAPAPAASSAPGDRSGKRGPRIVEGKPWEPMNSDGSLNLGSYAVQAAEGMSLLAQDLLVSRWRAGDAEAPPTQGQIRSLARLLLIAADRAQASARADGHADRMDNSHSRSRAAVRAALDIYPVPFGADQAARDAWLEDITKHASEFLGTVLSLVDREVP
jgi:hypothetical protein